MQACYWTASTGYAGVAPLMAPQTHNTLRTPLQDAAIVEYLVQAVDEFVSEQSLHCNKDSVWVLDSSNAVKFSQHVIVSMAGTVHLGTVDDVGIVVRKSVELAMRSWPAVFSCNFSNMTCMGFTQKRLVPVSDVCSATTTLQPQLLLLHNTSKAAATVEYHGCYASGLRTMTAHMSSRSKNALCGHCHQATVRSVGHRSLLVGSQAAYALHSLQLCTLSGPRMLIGSRAVLPIFSCSVPLEIPQACLVAMHPTWHAHPHVHVRSVTVTCHMCVHVHSVMIMIYDNTLWQQKLR